MPQISFTVHTASADSFMSGHGIPSYFLALVSRSTHQNGPERRRRKAPFSIPSPAPRSAGTPRHRGHPGERRAGIE